MHKLQNDVGSFALMHGTGFEQRDFLTCCKFAEGDTRILMQKMARDRVKQFVKKEMGSGQPQEWDSEQQQCAKIAKTMKDDPKGGWDKEWKTVYSLANTIIGRIMEEKGCKM